MSVELNVQLTRARNGPYGYSIVKTYLNVYHNEPLCYEKSLFKYQNDNP